MSGQYFDIDLVTPEGLLYQGEAWFVVVPAFDGELGFLYHRAPLMGSLGDGEMRVYLPESEDIERFAIQGGFVGNDGEKIVVLASRAQRLSVYDKEQLKERRADVEQRLQALEQMPLEEEEEPDPEILFLRDELSWVTLVQRLVK